MATDTKSCVRELEIEIPVDVVERETERVTREFARVAQLPGFRPGKAPAQLIRRRFWDDIRGEVLHKLVPSYLQNALRENNLTPIGDPSIRDLEFEPAKPLRFRASFEVLPEFELGEYKGLEVEPAHVEMTDEDLERELEGLRERNANFEPVEDRAAEDGDTVTAHLTGVVTDDKEERPPIVLEDAVVHVGEENTLEAFSTGVRGAKAGEERHFSVTYPEDYREASLAGRTVAFTAQVKNLKHKKLPELNDEFAKQVGKFASLDELKTKLRERMEEARAQREKEMTRQRLIEALLAKHDFPVPEALVERHLDARLDRRVRGLMAQGLDPRRLDVDWAKLRETGREAAVQEARLAILLDRIADAEKVEVSEEELSRELNQMAAGGRESAEALRARLTKEDRLDSMKSAIRSEKVVEFLLSHARLRAPSRG
ncbi:MAG TPA: trigger factor [Candidatus Acidoferrales bacterium]|nr:trigger factor [Candidatus Acidoferrales bacterium]